MVSSKGVVLLILCLSAALVHAQYENTDNNDQNNQNQNQNQNNQNNNQNQDQNGPYNTFCNDQEQSCYFDVCSERISGFTCDSMTGQITVPCTCEDGNSSPAVDPPSGTSPTPTPTSSPTPVTPTSSPTPAGPTSGAARTVVGVMSAVCISAAMMLA